jgi:hypothetical protein
MDTNAIFLESLFPSLPLAAAQVLVSASCSYQCYDDDDDDVFSSQPSLFSKTAILSDCGLCNLPTIGCEKPPGPWPRLKSACQAKSCSSPYQDG